MRSRSQLAQTAQAVRTEIPRIAVYGSSSLPPEEAYQLAVRSNGLVLPGVRGARLAGTLRRDYGYTGHLWLDAIAHLRRSEDGPAACPVQGELIDAWLMHQQEAKVTEYLTAPESVLRSGDVDGLCRYLATDSSPSNSRVHLALDGQWLSDHPDRLRKEITAAGRPIAISLRASFDPVNSAPRLGGLLKLVDLDVYLLRIDSSGIGALGHGARMAALGVSTYTRHVPGPVPKPKDEDPKPVGPTGTGVYVTALGAHHRANALQSMEAIGPAALGGLDECDCRPCDGRSLTRFAYVEDIAGGRRHDMAAVLGLAEALCAVPEPERPRWWQEHCSRSIRAHERLRRDHGVKLPVPGALRAWERLSM